ncbi:histidine phosphatase family protein [Nocardioides sp. TRM66260-LWL]|uniref:histidine phosphatase family protein n=1 Tax=Nocardioides sp. TRM66260-LWL TaxID=2874478 RepID=UPI001CC34E00|nr:histidine phosphatase family protein [Nocardioides sp. TRM66260-LWL]MBZ5734185.1 histidine phosphatase family protein [Nocardioides sp. TRM66260-LWL]
MADEVWLVRHGATEWSVAGRHTSTTDLPLLPEGEEGARALAPRLADVGFALVLTSPRQRARRTAELAGFPDAEVEPGLVEWDYGDYEGVTTATIRETVPGWSVWTHPVPGGETAEEVAARIDAVLARLAGVEGRALLFAHGHALPAVAARWLGLPVSEGRHLPLDTTTISVLGRRRDDAVVTRWNA